METRFFSGVTSAEIVPPSGGDLDQVHHAYVTMAAAGVVSDAQRAVFNVASEHLLKHDGVEAISLAGPIWPWPSMSRRLTLRWSTAREYTSMPQYVGQ